MRRDDILTAVEQYYTSTFEEHGATARGVDWNSTGSQELRFEQLATLLRHETGRFSINDVGCGYGALASFLEHSGLDATYTGYDLSERMLEHARAAFRERSDVRFVRGVDLSPADYSVASGIFNVKLGFSAEEWHEFVNETIASLAHASRKGFAFNLLSSYSDPERRRPDLHYADPCALFDACKRAYSRDVALLHDYGLWEFTIVVRQTP